MAANNDNLGARLLAWRRACGLSQSKAAARVGVPWQSWRNWETGRRHPGSATVRLLEGMLGTAERFEHEACPECGGPSVPAEKVPDQALRGCPRCGHTWFERANEANNNNEATKGE